MATDEKQIELLEKKVGGLQYELQKLAVGMAQRLQRLEESLKVISDVVLSSKTVPSPQLVKQELTNQHHYNHTDKAGAEGGHGTQKVNIKTEPLLRFIVLGKKSLPETSKKSRPYWGFVEMVTTRIDDIKDSLKGEEYVTATRGHSGSLLIGASEDIEEELGIELKTEQEENLSSAADASDLLRSIGDAVAKYSIERPAPKPPDS